MLLLISTVLSILALEAALKIFDPWGLCYFDDIALLWNHMQADPHRIAVLPPGEYHLTHWSATQLDNYTRRVPDNQGGPCTVVFVGDSMTWGHGVNDDETWVNLLAQDLPELTVINAGFDAYNSENVRGTLLDFPDADFYVYLIIHNDDEPTTVYKHMEPGGWIAKYVSYLIERAKTPSENGEATADPGEGQARFKADIAALSQDDRVVFVAFEQGFVNRLIPDYDVIFIPRHTRTISKVDAHPVPQGHRDIAEAMLPHIQAAMAEHCPAD